MAFNHENRKTWKRPTMMQSTKLATKLATKKKLHGNSGGFVIDEHA